MTRPNARPRSSILRPSALGLSIALGPALAVTACSGGDSPAGYGGEIEFRGEQVFLPGFDFDSGFLPEGSPVSVRATITAGGGVTVVSRATTDGTSLTAVPAGGSLAVEGGLTLEVSAKIEVTGAMFEGVVDSFEYTIAGGNQSFEAFAVDAPAVVDAMLPPAELGAVPIPGVPGATLVVDITGGTITTSFQGSCAEAVGGFGQIAGALTMEGTIAVGASVVIDIPFVLTETFGPFPIDVPIPAITTALDLGTRSLATGEVADAMGICDGAGTGGSESEPPSTTNDESNASSMPSTNADDTEGDDTDDDDTASSDTDPTTTPSDTSSADDDSSGGAAHGDPDYPNPFPDGCPGGYEPIAIGEDPPNGVCAPSCQTDDDCPSGATGSGVPLCAFNPDSTYADCVDDAACPGGETCIEAVCQLPPSLCVLLCEATENCPDGMVCQLGGCSYLP